ncbi:hypothetical protein AB3S75_039786 [Citrus x aurantiifolia]
MTARKHPWDDCWCTTSCRSLNQVKLDLNLMESPRICDSGRVSEAVIGQTSTSTTLLGWIGWMLRGC